MSTTFKNVYLVNSKICYFKQLKTVVVAVAKLTVYESILLIVESR